MFEEIKEQYGQHVANLELAFHESNELGLSPSRLTYRKLTKYDMEKLFEIIDKVQPQLNYDHMSGACLYVHSHLKKVFAENGYDSELVFGDVLIDGELHIGCNLDILKEQIEEGPSNKPQNVHCWLLLESGQFFDASIFRDITNGIYAAELYGYGITRFDGITFEHKVMLMGSEFINKTNGYAQVSI